MSSSVSRRSRPSLGPRSLAMGTNGTEVRGTRSRPSRTPVVDTLICTSVADAVPGGRETAGVAGKGTPAVQALVDGGVPHRLHEYDPAAGGDLGYGMDAAYSSGSTRSGCSRRSSSSWTGTSAGSPWSSPRSTGEVDLRAAAGALGAKRATLADQTRAERTTGYVAGGISPFGQRKALPTVLDETADPVRHDLRQRRPPRPRDRGRPRRPGRRARRRRGRGGPDLVGPEDVGRDLAHAAGVEVLDRPGAARPGCSSGTGRSGRSAPGSAGHRGAGPRGRATPRAGRRRRR